MIIVSSHQKRMSAPKSWQISKKVNKWITSTRPGPHNKQQSVPLIVVLRDMLGAVNNRSEAKKILSEGKVLVDGVARKDLRFPVGLMDVITIPLSEVSYRVLLDSKNRLVLHRLPAVVSEKLCRIEGKTCIRSGKVQLNLTDGMNIEGSNDYKTKDSVLLSIPEKEVLKHIEYREGNLALIIGGSHTGEVGVIKEINKVRSSHKNTVTISGEQEFETIEDYVFVIGENEPLINLGGEVID